GEDSTPIQITSWLNPVHAFVIVYTVVVMILFILFLRSLSYIRKISRRYPVEHIHTFKFYNTTEPGTPFSFFKSIFWNKRVDVNSHEGQQIFRHELFHVRQRHSADILFLEAVRVLLWINPFFHLIKKEIKAIHEFLADQHAVSNNNQHDYAELLLLQSITEKKSSLSTYFFQNHIKRRIAMITQIRSNKYSYWTRLMVLPVSLLLFCAIALYAQSPRQGSVKRDLVVDTPENLSQPITVLVDAGHGGEDAGARNAEGLLEKDLALAIARRISEHGPAYHVKVVMTRHQDVYPTLKERTEMAKTVSADLIISVHIGSAGNSLSEKPANGFDVYVTNRNKGTMEQSKVLGQSIVAELKDLYTVGAIKQRKENGIWILDAATCPAVLIECGYISNSKDVAFISDPQNQEQIAKRILQGIVGYKALAKIETPVDTIPQKKDATDTLKPEEDKAGMKPHIKTEESELAKKSQELEKKQKLHIQKQRELQLAQKKLNDAKHGELKKLQTIQTQKQRKLAIVEEKMQRARIVELQNLQKSQLQKQHQLQLAQLQMEKTRMGMLQIEKLNVEKHQELISEQTKMQKVQLAELQNHQNLNHQKQQEIALMQRKMVEERIIEKKKLEREHLEKGKQLQLEHRKKTEGQIEKMQFEESKKGTKPGSPKQSKQSLKPQSSQKPNPSIEQF
ncbi:MAG: N-acetylmuramoyl-L-alanine amidase, partial [Flavisolibacter sp.]